jgi:hypothetical protein
VFNYWRRHWRLLVRMWSGELGTSGAHGLVEKVILGVPQLARVVSPRSAFGDEGTDSYIVVCFFAMAALLWTSAWSLSHGLGWLWFLIVTWRIVDVLSHHAGVLFIDRRVADWKPRSRERTLAFAFVSFIELMIAFAVIYLWTDAIVSSSDQAPLSTALDAIYFSAVTMTTLGFGDFTPVRGSGRFVVVLQLLTALAFVSIVIQGFVSIALENERSASDGNTR